MGWPAWQLLLVLVEVTALNGNGAKWSIDVTIPSNGWWYGVPRENSPTFGEATTFRIEIRS